MSFDLLIRNGTVVDGSGLPRFRADVGVIDGRIARIGRIRESAEEVIDAEGHVVAPGFVDGHTHMDAQICWDPLGTCSSYHGVTSVVMGNCGFTLAPVRANARELVVRNLERAEDIDPTALSEGIDWNWESFPEYLDSVERTPKALHYAAQIGHSALRTWAMGERAFTEPASPEDLQHMTEQLEAALRAGAIGLSTSRSEHHETSDGRPVASRIANWSELRALAGVMSRLGVGILEGGSEAILSPDPELRDEALEEMRGIAVDLGVPLTAGLMATRDAGRTMLDWLDAIACQGGRAVGQTHCRGISVLLSFKTRLPFDVLSEWEPLRALPHADQRRTLSDPAVRERLAEAAMRGDYRRWRGIGAMPREPDYDGIQVYDHGLPPNSTLREVARQRGVSPALAMIELAVESNFEQLFIQPSLYPQDPDTLLAALHHPHTVMTFSDSGAHLSQICDASIHTHLLGHWVRDRQVFSLEEAVCMLTQAPARFWGLSDRGEIREGMIADLNILDPARVAPSVPAIVEDLPGGGPRLSQRAEGISATVVAGQVTLRDGEPTGALPGRLLRNHLARG